MTATNQQMTSEQLADLSTLAVQLQAKAEANDDRDTAVMAYAVQKACAELIESRREFTAANATIHNLELQLADAEARGVELLKEHINKWMLDMDFPSDMQFEHAEFTRACDELAAQLRQGAEK